jgi:hypothetical protein
MHDYNSVIKKFKDTSNIIKEYGYQEASKIPFLYRYKYKFIIFFFDLRIKKWKLSDPVWYWKWNEDLSNKLKRKVIYFEFNRISNISFRIRCDKREEISFIKDFYKYDVSNALKIQIDYSKYNNSKIINIEELKNLPYNDLGTILLEAMKIIKKEPSLLNECSEVMVKAIQNFITASGDDSDGYRSSDYLKKLITTEKNPNVLQFLISISEYLASRYSL